jgi:hypothetical protein
MNWRASGALLASACVAAYLLRAAPPADIEELARAFAHPPAEARMMTRWWWFGPAVTKPELEREMRLMKAGGFGGFEVQPVYPLQVDGNSTYLSREFLESLRFTAAKAKELGLRFDLTLGSGWPFGGPHIPLALAAPRLRVEQVSVAPERRRVALPSLEPGEKLIAALLAYASQGRYSGDALRLETIDGAVAAPPGARPGGIVLFFIESRTRQQVKRAAAGAEGYVLDHYSRAALDAHLQTVGDTLLGAVPGNAPYAVFSDSLEVYSSDWTPDFLQEFRARRGYDLLPFLPALAGDIGEHTGAIRHDWGLTLTELLNERYLRPLAEWARRHRTRFRSQTYGIPPASLSSNALVDLPEGEGFFWRRVSPARWAASAGHLYGRTVVSSETWTWLHSPVFRATPLDMKAEADLHFLQGVNQLIAHGWPYSPPQAPEPGQRFYAAAVFSQHNPWWLVMPDVAAYLQRVSFLLRQGRPANDVALYLPTADAYAGFALGRVSLNQAMDALIGPVVIPQILDAGYNFDFIDDGAIEQAGIPYRILILPGVERIPLSTYRKLQAYVRGGGILLAARRAPSLAPGLKEAAVDTPVIRELSRTLFTAAGAPAILVADESRLGATLRAALAPAVELAPGMGFIRRSLDFAEIYFLVNTTNARVRHRARFRHAGGSASVWDPFTGQVQRLGGGSGVDLDLAPYESRIVVFSQPFGREPAPPPRTPAPPPIDLSSDWRVAFEGSPDSIAMRTLRSWTDDAARKFYSGRATYERGVDVPQSWISSRRAVFLHFGEGTPVPPPARPPANGMRALLDSPVREAAMVSVNGKPAGSLWRPPYELEVSALLRPGQNSFRIVVANLAINHLAKGPLPDYRELIARFGDRFQPQDMDRVQPQPSGMLGPVRLVAR